MARQSPGALIELEQDPALADLVREWDFSLGKRFNAEVVHKFSSVHHPCSSPDSSFFLLVVFRRFLFRLTEEVKIQLLWLCTAVWEALPLVFMSLTKVTSTFVFPSPLRMLVCYFDLSEES